MNFHLYLTFFSTTQPKNRLKKFNDAILFIFYAKFLIILRAIAITLHFNIHFGFIVADVPELRYRVTKKLFCIIQHVYFLV